MKNFPLLAVFVIAWFSAFSQQKMTPELLWQLGRVSAVGLTNDAKSVVYRVNNPSIKENKGSSVYYAMPVTGGNAVIVKNADSLVKSKALSPDGKFEIVEKNVKVKKVTGKDFYPDLEKSNVRIYESLGYRHWDTWEDGEYSHLFVCPAGSKEDGKDIMSGEPYDCPFNVPSDGDEDYTWSADGKSILYVAKKKFGTDYMLSTNTDIYAYDLATGVTTNLTEGRVGYDKNPAFSAQGVLAWLSMKSNGYEADKNDIIVKTPAGNLNLTAQWDETVNSFTWSSDGKKIYFNAPVDGTVQLFEVDYPGLTKKMPVVQQITKGDFDVSGMVGQSGNTMVVTRTDMNHATELYTVSLTDGSMAKLTVVNDAIYDKIGMSKVERRFVTTTDKKQMLVWVIYPPDFNPAKKYPTLLVCQGGPQSALTQSYSFRWNYQLMAANGYVVVAPNRRGMPGHGVAWNEEISKDHGGQAIQDLLSAIDDVAKEPYVDKTKLAAVGASYGGYSVFQLAGVHNNRFKTLIAHDGIFNTQSMYGTTEELFFVNWDYGGAYWEKSNKVAMKAYNEFNPSKLVDKWNKPILIIQGGKDFRVPDGQGFEAFQAAQLRGIKSKLLYFPEENHWILTAQNAQVWQREFYKWLDETLK
jgi:dipeptidyl aminopeptidase/acylaminoacyl peptidase